MIQGKSVWETDIESQARDYNLVSRVWRREKKASLPRGSALEGKQLRKGQAHAKAYRCSEGGLRGAGRRTVDTVYQTEGLVLGPHPGGKGTYMAGCVPPLRCRGGRFCQTSEGDSSEDGGDYAMGL